MRLVLFLALLMFSSHLAYADNNAFSTKLYVLDAETGKTPSPTTQKFTILLGIKGNVPNDNFTGVIEVFSRVVTTFDDDAPVMDDRLPQSPNPARGNLTLLGDGETIVFAQKIQYTTFPFPTPTYHKKGLVFNMVFKLRPNQGGKPFFLRASTIVQFQE